MADLSRVHAWVPAMPFLFPWWSFIEEEPIEDDRQEATCCTTQRCLANAQGYQVVGQKRRRNYTGENDSCVHHAPVLL